MWFVWGFIDFTYFKIMFFISRIKNLQLEIINFLRNLLYFLICNLILRASFKWSQLIHSIRLLSSIRKCLFSIHFFWNFRNRIRYVFSFLFRLWNFLRCNIYLHSYCVFKIFLLFSFFLRFRFWISKINLRNYYGLFSSILIWVSKIIIVFFILFWGSLLM